MSLHFSNEKPPQTAAEELALHLETHYGLQLDSARHAGLLTELKAFLEPPPPQEPPEES